jgi:cytochrome c oxidase cbb3-type subunit 3
MRLSAVLVLARVMASVTLAASGLAVSGLSAYGQGHQPAPEQRPPQPADSDAAAAEQGHALFKSSCGFCHGNDATGSRAPDLVRSTIVNHDNKGDLLAPMIRNGRPDKGMPSFSTLKDDQLAEIIAFLHSRAEAALHSAGVPGDYPASKLLTGNAAAGKTYFNGAGGCSGCHSVSKDLAGIATRMSPVDLQQAMVYPAKEEGGPKSTATVTFKDGTHYEGTVVHNDEFLIGIMCQDGWYRSWPTSEVDVKIKDPLQAHRDLMAKYTDADMHNLFAYLETLK